MKERQKEEILRIAKMYLKMGGVYDEISFSEFSPILVEKVIKDILLYANRDDIPEDAHHKVGELIALAYLTKIAELKALGGTSDGDSSGEVSSIKVGDASVSFGSWTKASISSGASEDVVMASRNYDLALKAFIPQIRKVTW